MTVKGKIISIDYGIIYENMIIKKNGLENFWIFTISLYIYLYIGVKKGYYVNIKSWLDI